MPNRKKDLSTTPTSTSKSVKPVPPINLWEHLDKVREEAIKYIPEKLADGEFTIKDYIERYKVSDCVAANHLERLIKAGVIENTKKKFLRKNVYKVIKHG